MELVTLVIMTHLASLTGDDAVVDTAGLVSAHLAGDDLNLCCKKEELSYGDDNNDVGTPDIIIFSVICHSVRAMNIIVLSIIAAYLRSHINVISFLLPSLHTVHIFSQ